MNFIVIILSFFAAVILYILVVPVILKIDTYENNYFFRMPGIFGLKLKKKEGIWKAGLSVLFFRIKFPFFKKGRDQSRKIDRTLVKKKRAVKTRRIKLLYKIVRTFQIKRLLCEIDSGDFPLNAKLIPLAHALSSQNISFSVNFSNSNNLYLIVYTRLYKIIYQIIKNINV
jgi:hypothetical protein